MTDFRDDMTLGAARDLLRTMVDEGHPCPCCKQMAKVYRRRINSTMARTLIKIWRAGGRDTFVHTASLPGDTHEASQLSWWGLIMADERKREDGGKAGQWKLTPLGISFVHARALVPEYARIYDGKVLSLTGDQVSIQHCLGKRFNYRELMEGV